MKTFVLVAVAFGLTVGISMPAHADDGSRVAVSTGGDELTLVDGSVLRGKISQQALGSHVVISTLDGRTHTIPWSQVAHVETAAADGAKADATSSAPRFLVASSPEVATKVDVSRPPASDADVPTRGLLFSLRTGVLVPAGRYGDASGLGLGDFGPGASSTLSIGYYVTPHIGLIGGVRGSYGHRGVSGCSSSDRSCGGYTIQVPLMVEYAPSGRTRGFFLDGGIGLFTTYAVYSDAGTLTATSPVEAKLGVGYRWEPVLPSPQGPKHTGWGVELYANVDMGQFSHLEGSSPDGDFSGDVASDKKAIHAAFDVGLAVYWGP